MADPIILATRKSPLALRQAELAGGLLAERMPEASLEYLPLSTTGDEKAEWSLIATGGKGLFTKELEDALLEGRATLAIHSAKDVPTTQPDGLALAGFLPREDPRDVLILREGREKPRTLATSSPRRQKQLAHRFPSVSWTEIRGNVTTRLRKIADGEADGTVLARAGLNRLGIESHEGLTFTTLQPDDMVPAPAQGAIAVQCRVVDRATFAPLLDAPTAYAATLERTLLQLWEGGCKTAFGALLYEFNLYLFHEEHGFHRFGLSEISGETAEEKAQAVFASFCGE